MREEKKPGCMARYCRQKRCQVLQQTDCKDNVTCGVRIKESPCLKMEQVLKMKVGKQEGALPRIGFN